MGGWKGLFSFSRTKVCLPFQPHHYTAFFQPSLSRIRAGRGRPAEGGSRLCTQPWGKSFWFHDLSGLALCAERSFGIPRSHAVAWLSAPPQVLEDPAVPPQRTARTAEGDGPYLTHHVFPLSPFFPDAIAPWGRRSPEASGGQRPNANRPGFRLAYAQSCGLAPGRGFEPRTDRLTADCSTAELPRIRGAKSAVRRRFSGNGARL